MIRRRSLQTWQGDKSQAEASTGKHGEIMDPAISKSKPHEALAHWQGDEEPLGNFINSGLGDASTVAKNAIQSVPYGPIPYAS